MRTSTAFWLLSICALLAVLFWGVSQKQAHAAKADPQVVCTDHVESNGLSFLVTRPTYRELRLFFFASRQAEDLLIIEEKGGGVWATNGEGSTNFNMRRTSNPLSSELCVKEPLTGYTRCFKLDCAPGAN